MKARVELGALLSASVIGISLPVGAQTARQPAAPHAAEQQEADYRVIAATQDTPASLEVRCTLKGPYPAVRTFVTALLQDTPALTLKEFALSRASADVTDVEAKLAVVVYLAAGTSATEGTHP